MSRRRVAYIDAFSGVAGDMLLAALLDLGVDIETLEHELRKLKEIKDEWKITVSTVTKSRGQIAAKYVKVTSVHGDVAVSPPALAPGALSASTQETGHDHDHSHDHSGHDHAHAHEHAHDHNHANTQTLSSSPASSATLPDHHHAHGHAHEHSHGHGHSHQHERGLIEIAKMILGSDLSKRVKAVSLAAFHELALAEAHVHHSTLDQVHFHEVGAIDSIIDTVGVVIACDLLHLLNHPSDHPADHSLGVSCSALPMTTQGSVYGAHGIMPVPAPATLHLLRGMALGGAPRGARGELITPTGAALIRALCGFVDWRLYPPYLHTSSNGNSDSDAVGRLIGDINQWGKSPHASDATASKTAVHNRKEGARQGGPWSYEDFVLEHVGVGAGTKDFDLHPNIVRILLGSSSNPTSTVRTPSLPQPTYTSSNTTSNTASTDTSLPTTSPSSNALATQKIVFEKKEADDVMVPNTKAEDEAEDDLLCESVALLTTNIDDMTAEHLAHVAEVLREGADDGVLDVWLESIAMKKGRGTSSQLCVLVRCLDSRNRTSETIPDGDNHKNYATNDDHIHDATATHSKDTLLSDSSFSASDDPVTRRVVRQMLLETSSLGVRVQRMTRYALPRSFVSLTIRPFEEIASLSVSRGGHEAVCEGEVRVKVAHCRGRIVTAKAEFDDCLRLLHRIHEVEDVEEGGRSRSRGSVTSADRLTLKQLMMHINARIEREKHTWTLTST